MLIFSQFVEALKALAGCFDAAGTDYSFLDGSMSAAERQKEIDRFQNEKKTGLPLLSPKAGGMDINLTEADNIVILDPWWNPAAEMQAVNRCFHMGQTRRVFAYKFLTKGTVERHLQEPEEGGNSGSLRGRNSGERSKK